MAGLGPTVLQCVQQNEAECGFVQLIPLTCGIEFIQVIARSIQTKREAADDLFAQYYRPSQ